MNLSGFTRTFIQQSNVLVFFAPPGESSLYVPTETIDELRAEAAKSKCNARICLHSSPGELLHDMIIAEHQSQYIPPHYHTTKRETIISLKEALSIYTFDDNGNVDSDLILTPGDTFSVEAGKYHMVRTRSDLAIYREIKLGPFIRRGDSISAPWAPARNEDPTEFLARLPQ